MELETPHCPKAVIRKDDHQCMSGMRIKHDRKGSRFVRQKAAAVVDIKVVVAARSAKKSRVLESSFCEMIEMDRISTPHVTCDWVDILEATSGNQSYDHSSRSTAQLGLALFRQPWDGDGHCNPFRASYLDTSDV